MSVAAVQSGGSLLDRPIARDSTPRRILVAGASGGIGSAFCAAIERCFPESRLVRLARTADDLPATSLDTLDLEFDISDERRITEAVGRIDPDPIDWVFVATGWLHGDGMRPEKTYKQLDADRLLHAYRINAIGPALLVKHLVPRLANDRPARIGVLSARVGSISDNRLGGWHAYRASKAGLNMLIKNYALEWSRNRLPHVIVGLQPGTTDTPLSAPFQRNVPKDQLQTPQYTADQLMKVMQRLRPEDSGSLYDFLGLPFEP